jgi:uncharacterized membrane protein YcaP (DUF421 family)
MPHTISRRLNGIPGKYFSCRGSVVPAGGGMGDIFVLQHPWWELVLRGALVYLGVLAMLRFSGKREVGQFTPFDLALLLIISEAVSPALTAEDESWTGGMLVVATMLAVNWCISLLTLKSRRFDRFLEGEPELIIRDGRVDYGALRRLRMSKKDLLGALRQHGCEKPSEVKFAVLEPSGEITLKKCNE